jgi:hypothetical protein
MMELVVNVVIVAVRGLFFWPTIVEVGRLKHIEDLT